MNEIKLKPCPFCGDEAFGSVESGGRNCSTEYLLLSIKCNNGDCHTSKYKKIEMGYDKMESLENAINELVKEWNTRVG